MENAPINPADSNPDKKKDGAGKQKKKNAEALGVFAVEPGPTKDRPAGQPENIWEKLSLTKRKSGETIETTPLAEVIKEAEARRLPEVSEAEAEAETLSEPEEQFAERSIIEARQQAGHEAGPDVSEGEALAAAEAVELFRSKVVSGGEPVAQAFTEVLQELDAGESEPRSAEPEAHPATLPDAGRPAGESPEPTEPSSENPLAETSTLEAERIPEVEPTISTPIVESEPLNEDAEQLQNVPPAGGGGSGMPPRPATAGNYYPPAPNAAPAVRTEKEIVPYYNNEQLIGAAFLGGLVGYFIGRRRGRIKTERKLKPIQKKLEKQVEAMDRDIAFKEAYIAKTARQRVHDRDRFQRLEQSSDRDQRRIEALEASQLHGKNPSPERIGHVIVAAQEKPAERGERVEKPEKSEKPEPKPIDKHIETMGRAELLELSQAATVENTTLRQVYETHLVGEQGLRRLMSEYVRGGDVQEALREELLEHEIDFERDPMLRDRPRDMVSGGASASESLEHLLKKANVLNGAEAKEELAVLKARQAHQETQRHEQQKHRRVLDVSMVAAITILFVLVVMLLMRGR
jgi:hypothetical protein